LDVGPPGVGSTLSGAPEPFEPVGEAGEFGLLEAGGTEDPSSLEADVPPE
jgi:hypothetical protein